MYVAQTKQKKTIGILQVSSNAKKLKNKMSFQKNNKRIHALQVIPKQCGLQRG
jgi:hypothetical protein